eukprot:gene51917-14083_t
MDHHAAVACCREHLTRGPGRMAQALTKSALDRGTMDNVTVAV